MDCFLLSDDPELYLKHDVLGYTNIQELGIGRYATVFEARHKVSGERVAMKAISKDIVAGANPKFIIREKQAFEMMKKHTETHPIKNVVKFFDYTENEEYAFFIMEYIDGYTLQRVIYESRESKNPIPFTDSELKTISINIIEAVRYIHSVGVYHGDLKPENIVVIGTDIKLVDFGCAETTNDKYLRAKDTLFRGTPGFSPPEASKPMPEGTMVLCEHLDLWGLGCCIYYIYSGIVPFVTDSIAVTWQNVYDVKVDYELVPQNIANILSGIFRKNPNERLSVEEVYSLFLAL
ncbi:Serine/threonine-protein kinase PLK4 [Astathelohania contejeani]|uniref:Serine/threonine-protein kinase PLK4 n=1 Tax=Astathelohania contejeani TaxID=164912 RepID=A0ABQ7HZ17_9MICR|nr:Serine/threonine-protein kinase PLK4 [Thelohania contejeani]